MTTVQKNRLLDCVSYLKNGLHGINTFTHGDSPLEQSRKLNELKDYLLSLADVVQNVIELDGVEPPWGGPTYRG